MGKKKRKKHLDDGHREHHRELEEMRQQLEEDTPSDVHVVPAGTNFHIPRPWCYCVPEKTYTHPLTQRSVYSHRAIIH